jgi:hypothetical protein
MKIILISIAIITTISSCSRINTNESQMTGNNLKGISFDYSKINDFVQK